MARGSGSLSQGLVVLNSLLHVLSIVFLNVMMGANGLFQIIINHLTWALGTGSSNEEHNLPTCSWVAALWRKIEQWGKYKQWQIHEES
jgi:hypothetical protein